MNVRVVGRAIALGCLGACMGMTVACGGGSGATHDVTSPQRSEDGGGATEGGTPFVGPTSTDGGTTSDAPVVVAQDSGAAPADAAPMASGTYPAPFPAPPQVVNMGGGVLASPKIVALFFNNDDPATVTSYTAFYNGIGNTQYWAALSEYGVGKPAVTVVNLSQAAPTTIDDSFGQTSSALQTWLLGLIGTSGVPANDSNTQYMINYPATTTITSQGASGGGGGCDSFGGYHSMVQDASGNLVAYGVLPRCPGMPGFVTTDQSFTSGASHEIVEAATDPYDPGAFLQADGAHIFWDYANSGSEIGDMCENDPEAYFQFADFPYVVQRFWSNAAAKAGHDPCVPEIPNTAFFAAVPEVNDTKIPFPDDVGNIDDAAGTKIAVGASATINLDLYSDKPTSPWTVQVQDFNELMGGSPLLTLTLPKASGNNGDKLPLTIKVNQAGTASESSQGNGQWQDTELYLITVSQGQTQHSWIGLVGN